MKRLEGTHSISVTWRGKKFVLETSSVATLIDLGHELQKLTGVKPDTMRLIVPKSSTHSAKLLSPFSDEHSYMGLQETFIQEGKPIRMMGASNDEVDEIISNAKADLRIAGFEEEDKRLRQRMIGISHLSIKLPQGTYIFCGFRTLQLPGVELNPPPSKALKRMHMLAADPGIVAIMNKHRWRVGIMTEMAPEGYVGVSPECILGFNKNQGEEISLRLRTDDLKGFRKYDSIKKTLLHELAHMVHSKHDANFHALDKQLNQEAFSLDWTRSRSHTLSGVMPSTHYEEEFDIEEYSSIPQKLGGNTSDQLASARSSSVAAAYRRITNMSSNESEGAREVDHDFSEINMHGGHNPIKNVSIENLEQAQRSNNESDPDDCIDNQNNLEPDPDDSVGGDNMESEPYSGTWESNVTSESNSGDIKMTPVVPTITAMDISETTKISEEPDPDDAEAGQKNLGHMNIVLTNDESSLFTETMQEQSPEKKVYKEPDPDDSLANGTHPDNQAVSSIVSAKIDTSEPDPDDQELKRIHDPVTEFYNRLQKSIEAVQAEVNSQEVMIVLQTIFKIISNVIEHPNDVKFKKLRKANPVFRRNVANYRAAMEILFLIGFNEDVVSDEIGKAETYLVLKRNDPGLLWLAKSSLENIIAF